MIAIRRFLAAAVTSAVVALNTSAQAVKSNQVQKPQTFTTQVTRTVTLNYLLFLPRGYDAQADKKWPLMLFLHGAGERGSDIWLVAKHGPPKIVAEKPDFPFILVSPQCPAGKTWADDEVLALLDDIEAKYAVDKTRVYLTGLSMGGYGTWSLGIAHPERFAAIVPICGGGDPLKILLPDPKREAALKTLAVWAFHGGKDPVVNLTESKRMVEALKKFGCQEVELTVFPEAGHDSWTEAYADPKLYEWLLQHQRK